MQAGSRKNIYAISEVVPDTDDRNLERFITHSKWSGPEVLDHVARDADELIGTEFIPYFRVKPSDREGIVGLTGAA
jgi:hypothetical protein